MSTLASDLSAINRRTRNSAGNPRSPIAARVSQAARSLVHASWALSDAASRVSNRDHGESLRRMAENIDGAVPAIYRLGRTLRRKD